MRIDAKKVLLLLALSALAPLRAAQVELQLVVHDQPETTVDKMEHRRVIASPVSTAKGVEMKTIGIDVGCWARNVMLDGKSIFERYHDGKYIDRLPIARADLPPGDHTIWPGNHVFTVAKDGAITAKSGELLVAGNIVRIKCYPVTINAFRANPEESGLPQSMRTAQLPTLTVRESGNAGAAQKKDAKTNALELIPTFEKFAPLCIWLPGNTAEKGYVIHPLGLEFHLGGEGIKQAEGGKAIPGIQIQKTSVDIPLYGFPVFGDTGSKLIISGVEQMMWDKAKQELTNWYPRGEPYELKVSESAAPLKVDGDPRQWTFKSFRLDIPDRTKPAPRLLAVEMERRHFDAGGAIQARVQAVDSARAGDAAQLDLATQASVLARVRAYGAETWTSLSVKPGAAGVFELSVPELDDGVYRLQVSVTPQGSSTPLAIDRWISIAKPRPAGIGLFTVRGRVAFQRGENFFIGLGVTGLKEPLAAGTAIELDLVDATGKKLPVLRQKATAPLKDRESILIRFDGEQSLALAAGTYTAEARIGTLSARPLPLRIVETDPTTHFTTLITGKYNDQGDAYADVLHSGDGADALVRSITEMGHNSFQGMSYDLNRVVRPSAEVEEVARERRELGPWESYYQPSGRDRFLDAAVTHRLRFYEDLMTYNDTMLPRDEKILGALARYGALETASMRFSPAFKGVCLYDEIYSVADTGKPMSAQFLTAQELNYRTKNPGLTSADAMKALERYASRPLGQRKVEDLQKFKTWPAYEDSEWGILSKTMVDSVKAVMPDSQNFTLLRYWGANGGNIAPNGMAQDVFAPLDAAACVMYKDGGNGDRPVFAPMQADVMRVRDDLPVWTQLHTFHASGLYGSHLLRQAFFAISQKIDGLTFFSIPADHRAPNAHDNRDVMDDIAGKLCTRYGDLFISLQKGYKKVAIYYSREADYLEAKKPNKLTFACEGLWVACARAGFPADFLFDEMIRAGKGAEYDVIFAPGFNYEDEASPEILAALRKLVNAGKTVVVERASKLPIDGVQRLDSDLDEYDDKMGGAFPKFIDFETEMVFDQSEETTKLVRNFLSKRIKPAAIHNLLIGPDWLKRGQGEYMVVPNFADTGFSGLHKTLYQAPQRPTLKFPKRPPVCYDMLEMKRAEVATDGEWMSLQADMRECPGKIFAFLPAEIAKVELKTVVQAKSNSPVNYQVSVVDKNGQTIDAAFPIQITISDATGATLNDVYRAADPVFAGVFHLPANIAVGNVKLKARELISGKTVEATITVSAGENPVGKVDGADVRVSDVVLLKKFMADKGPIVIALDPEQTWCKAEAERLAAALEKRGRAVRVVPVEGVVRLPVDWNDKAPIVDGTRLWRGDAVEPGLFVDSPLILIGKRYDNRLIEALAHRDVLAEVVSDNFPGRGRALLGCVHQAFSNQFDTATLLANDEAGLKKGVDALLAVENQIETHAARPTVKIPAVDRAAMLSPAQNVGSEPLSFTEMIRDTDRIRSFDVDAAGRIVVGTMGYGHNLFCFEADGKLRWKQFLPEHNVYNAQWFDNGKKIVAATGQGNFLFLIDAADGRVFKKLKISEWPNFHYAEGAENTESQIVVNAKQNQILVRGVTGIFALDFDGKKMWYVDRAITIASYPENAEQILAAEFGASAVVGNIAIDAEGKRIAFSETQIVGTTSVMNVLVDLWGHRPKILDAATGKVLLENSEDGGSSTSSGGWWCSFSAAGEPLFHSGNFMRALQADGKLGPVMPEPRGRELADGSALLCGIDYCAREKNGADAWRMKEPREWLTDADVVNAARTRLYRSGWGGLLRCVDVETGKTVWEKQLATCAWLRVIEGKDATGEQLVVGAKNGALLKIDATGKVIFQTRLRELHENPEKDYATYVSDALARDVDSTAELFPVKRDRPGEYDKTLRMGIEQITNGDFETADAWQCESGAPKVDAPGHSLALPGADEGKSLNIQAGQLVTQPIKRPVIPSATYLLEFMYRVEKPGARLIAGVLLKGAKETLTASKFEAKAGEWNFGRVAVKSMENTSSLEIGFEAEGGDVRVDKASLRAVRFPSANLLANSELHQIEPTFVKDIRVRYNRIPSALRDKLMGRNHVTAYKQGQSTIAPSFSQEEAFLQNGRLDDVGQIWTYMPDNIGFSVTLTKPAHVSHVVLYLNNATPKNVYETIAIVANRLDESEAATAPEKGKKPQRVQGLPHLEALVRCNEQRFIVVHFEKPILTDSIKILPGKHPGRKDCITEIEIYGPLGGGTGPRVASSNPLDAPMFMGNGSHVPAALPADVTGEYSALRDLRGERPVFNAGVATFDGLFAYGDPSGAIRSVRMPASDPRTPPPKPEKGKPAPQPERIEEGPNWPLASVTPTTTPAHYSGRIFVGSADAKLHAVADNGTYLWAFSGGGRIYSSPLPNGDDVYFGCDDGKLYKIDVDSGALIWEFATGGKVRGSPALADGRVILASGDGNVYAVSADTGVLAWKAPIAKFSRSSAAIAKGSVFIGDEAGGVYCLDATNGKTKWKHTLKGYVSHCPVVCEDGVFFASEQGDAVFLGADGSVKWKRDLETRVSGQAIATQSQLLIPSERGLLVLHRADGKADERFTPPEKLAKCTGVQVNNSRLFLTTAEAVTDFRNPPRTYATYKGGPAVWAPKSGSEASK
jgi:outer membrane protein assembly factor BamB